MTQLLLQRLRTHNIITLNQYIIFPLQSQALLPATRAAADFSFIFSLHRKKRLERIQVHAIITRDAANPAQRGAD
jgi:hypothetical protein